MTEIFMGKPDFSSTNGRMDFKYFSNSLKPSRDSSLVFVL